MPPPPTKSWLQQPFKWDYEEFLVFRLFAGDPSDARALQALAQQGEHIA